jgi:aryl carrier-like protein
VRYRHPSLENTPIAAFDVVIVNGRGEVLVDVEAFLMRRAEGHNADFAKQPSRISADMLGMAKHRSRHSVTSLPQVLEYAISPTKGIEALDRVLGQALVPQIIVSPLEPNELLASIRASGEIVENQERTHEAPQQQRDRINLVDGSVLSPTDIAKIITSLWKEALGVENIADRDDFFNLGGHSLSLVQVAARLRQTLNIDIPLSTLIEQSTVAHWTRAVNRALGAGGGQEDR